MALATHRVLLVHLMRLESIGSRLDFPSLRQELFAGWSALASHLDSCVVDHMIRKIRKAQVRAQTFDQA